MESTHSRMKPQNVWGWKIAIYLFLGGVGGGAYVGGYVLQILRGATVVWQTGVLLSVGCLSVGSLFLIADLDVKHRFWRAFTEVGDSWIARGTWIISGFLGLNVLHLGLWTGWMDPASGLAAGLGLITALFGVAVMVYTGLLLSASRPITFWNAPRLPVLFLVSATSTGIMSLILLGPLYADLTKGFFGASSLHLLSQLDVGLILLEGLALMYFLSFDGSESTMRARSYSRQQWLKGALSAQFWGMVVTMGLLIPLVVEGLSLAGSVSTTVLNAAMVSGLVGGLWLRWVVLAAGYYEPLQGSGLGKEVPSQAQGQRDPFSGTFSVPRETVHPTPEKKT